MEPEELLSLYDSELRREVEITRMRRETLPGVVRYIEEGNTGGFVSWADMPVVDPDEVIDAQIGYFSQLVPEFSWKVFAHDLPSDLGSRLQKKGFTPQEPCALMVMDLDDAPEYLWTWDTDCVRRVTTTGEIDQIMDLETEIWNLDLPGIRKGLKVDLFETPHLVSIYGVWQDGRVVSAAWQFFLLPARWVSLHGGSTLAQYRKHGYYTALIAARAREARERGSRFLTVEASPDSRPILERHGFTNLGQMIEYEWKRAGH